MNVCDHGETTVIGCASCHEVTVARLEELEAAATALAAASKSQGTRTVLVSFDALIALEDLLPDQSGDGESVVRHLTTDEQDVLLQSLWNSVQIIKEPGPPGKTGRGCTRQRVMEMTTTELIAAVERTKTSESRTLQAIDLLALRSGIFEALQRLEALETEGTRLDASILPMHVDDGTVTMCTSISGGAQECEGMPKELTLLRTQTSGRCILARYKFAERLPALVQRGEGVSDG